jgi:hypothetical protein
MTVITHPDLTSLSTSQLMNSSRWFKVLALFLHFERTIDFHEFHVNGEIKIDNFVKHKFYLLYSQSREMRGHKRMRHMNRKDIIHNRPYSIRFHVYELDNDQIKELGIWQYQVQYDFLPVYHLATVLRFPVWYSNSSLDPCSNNTSCPQNANCRPVFNQKHPTFSCICTSGILTNTNNPLCICRLHHFGPRCNLRHEECHSQPCLNNGSCHLINDLSGPQSFACICLNTSYGDRCENEKVAIRITINMTRQGLASVFQFYDVNNKTFQLIIRYQQVTRELPTSIRYNHGQSQAPVLGMLKMHDNLSKITYFIIYIQPNRTVINITSTPEQCHHVSSFLLLKSES